MSFDYFVYGVGVHTDVTRLQRIPTGAEKETEITIIKKYDRKVDGASY